MYPMAAAATAAAAGIAAAETEPFDLLPVGSAGASWVLTCATGLLAWRIRSTSLWLLATSCLFASLHVSHLGETRDHPLRKVLLREDRPLMATVTGQWMPGPDPQGPEGTLIAQRIEFSHIPGDEDLAPVRLRVILPNERTVEPAEWSFRGRLYLPRPPSTEGGFDRAHQLWRDGFAAVLKVQSMTRVGPPSVRAKATGLLHRGSTTCRDWIGRQLTLDLADESPQASILRGMILGEAGAAGSAVENTFRDSGTLHLFAVSGLHVGLIALVGWALLRWLPFHRSTHLVLLVLMVFAYAFVTGWRPSAARAAWMIALMLSAGLIGRRRNLLNSLGVAAVVLLAIDTHQLFRPGFQLSFGVLMAIIIAVPWLMQKVAPWVELDPFLPRQLATSRQLGGLWLRQSVASVAAVSIAAWLGSFPLMLWHFQSVAPIGMMANCLLVPLAFCALLTSCLSLSAAALHLGGVQIMFNNANWFFATVILQLTGWFSDAPGSRWSVATEPPDAPAEGVFFDVPNGGGAAWMRIGTRHWLWDTGPRPEFEFTIAPYLERRGVQELDGLILSHNDIQHIGGAAPAIEALRPKRVFHGLHEPWPYDSGLTVLPALLRQPAPSIQWTPLGLLDRIDLGHLPSSSVFADVLHPGALDLQDHADNRALCCRIRIGPWTVLWMPDAGFPAEKQLLDRYMDLRADLLFHTLNASDPGCLPEFLARVRPRLVLTSNEANLPEEQVPGRWIEACQSLGIPRWNTREVGSVLWSVEDSGDLEIRTQRGDSTLRWRADQAQTP